MFEQKCIFKSKIVEQILASEQNLICANKSLVSNSKFEYKSSCETKFLKNSLAAKPNCANKRLVSNSLCLSTSLLAKPKVLFQIQNV